MSLLNLKCSPSRLTTDEINHITLSCEMRYMGLWPFVEACTVQHVAVDSWPSHFPFWVLVQVFGGIDIQKIEIQSFIVSKVRLIASDEIQAMRVWISAIYDGRL